MTTHISTHRRNVSDMFVILGGADGHSTAELAAAVNLTGLTVRKYMERAVSEGFVDRTRLLIVGPGRPADLWRLSTRAQAMTAIGGVDSATVGVTRAEMERWHAFGYVEIERATRRWNLLGFADDPMPYPSQGSREKRLP